MPSRTIIYDRVSVRDDASQAEHLDRCRDFARARGYEVVAEHIDTASGFSKTAKRPGWDRVVAAVEADEVDVVLVFATSRAGRNLARFAAFLELAKDHDVAFVSATEPIDTSGPMGLAILALLSALAEMESNAKRERTLVGRATAKRNGTWTGGKRRFGLTVDESNVLQPHPTEAPLVRKAATDVLNGTTLREVARAWNKAGATTTGGKPWHPDHVRDLLAAESNVPLILTKADHARLRDLFDSRRTGKAPERFPLSGLLRCAVDGSPMTGRGGGRSKGRDGRTQPRKYLCDHGPEGRRVHMTVDADALDDYVFLAVDRRDAERPFQPVEARDPADDLVAERDRLIVELEALGESALSEHVIRGRERRLLRDLDEVEQRLAEGKPAAASDFWSQNPDLAVPWETKVRQHVRRIVVSPAGKAARRFSPDRVKIEWTR